MLDEFPPTQEQQLVYASAEGGTENLLISALAGAAKTTTLVGIARRLPVTDMLCLAFNKKIANEMAERLPSNCKAQTLNSLGYSIWRQSIRVREVTVAKNGDILHRRISEHYDPVQRGKMFENLGELIKLIGTGKQSGWIPDAYPRESKRLVDDANFFGNIPEELEDYEREIVIGTTCESLDAAFAGILDYDDQILMPTVFQSSFPRPSLTLVDEAQDLSPLNHAMLRKLVGKRRLIAVGDECQAIYGFRGADSASMYHLEKEFDMRKLMLSISFRCPKKVVEHARWRAPQMKYPEWAKEGAVDYWHTWTVDEIPADAAIVCRNNAPLFGLALRMLKAGRYATIVGNDIGKGLLKTMKKFGPSTMPQEDVIKAIEKWKAEKIEKTRDHGPVHDRAECMLLFAKEGETLGQAMAWAEQIFNADSPVKLMTGHKSKGLEFDNVFILDRELLKEEQQDKNLRYVMQTRAKETLTYIDTYGLEIQEKTDVQ